MMKDLNDELKNIIEAALLAAGQPLTVEKMQALFPEGSQPTREEIRAALNQLQEDYAGRGLELKQIDRAYRVHTREKYAAWVGRLAEERPTRYSRALLETLAIIAYRQPVTRGDIEDIRGVVVTTEIIRTLLGREWIRELGKREVPGRPVLYGTTRAFLEHFNLERLEDLPPLAELRDISAIGAQLDLRIGESADRSQPDESDGESGSGPAAADDGRVAVNEPEATESAAVTDARSAAE